MSATKYSGREAKWFDPIDGIAFSYLMGLDALAVSLGHEPIYFPLERVLAWIDIRARQLRGEL